MTLLRRLSLVLTWTAAALSAQAEDKLTTEQLITRHAASIGDAAARAAAAGRVAKGSLNYIRKPMGERDNALEDRRTNIISEYESAASTGSGDAFAGRNTNIVVPAVLASGGPRYLIDLRYGWKNYPFDRVVYDGKQVKNARTFTPGNYSVLAGLLKDNEYLLKAGLLGGPLTTAWALLDPGDRFEKLEYAGLKKADGRQAHRLDARLKSDPDHEISFYFDPETFRLRRTQIWIGPNARRKLEEDFSDYKTVEGLTLPHTWEMRLDAPVDRWIFKLEELRVATELPEEAFVVK